MQLVDTVLTDFFARLIPHDPVFDTIFWFFSFVGSYALIWIAILILLFMYEEHRNGRFMWFFVLALTATFIITISLKLFIGRPRPPSFLYVCPLDFSFPSMHASLAFCAASILGLFDKRRRAYYFAIAIAIAFSRIYLECHYFFDVIAGVLIGLTVGRVARNFLKLRASRPRR